MDLRHNLGQRHFESGDDSEDSNRHLFPSINIPVVAVAWTYTGLSPEETEGRITTVYERILTTTVDNIEHIESTTVNGTAIVKIYLQPSASIDRANAQITAVSQAVLRQLPPGALPPLIVNYNASTVPILQLGLSGKGLTEPQLNDIALNFLRLVRQEDSLELRSRTGSTGPAGCGQLDHRCRRQSLMLAAAALSQRGQPQTMTVP
jgi:hypothetical protein